MDAPAPAGPHLDAHLASPVLRPDAGDRFLPRPVQAALLLLLALGLAGLAGGSVLHGSRTDSSIPTITGRIDLNRASLSELLLLPGIGPQLAQRIDEHRRNHGPFKTVDDLRKVPGVGPALLERIRPKATVGSDLPPRPVAPVHEPLVEPPAKASRPSKIQALSEPIDINQADVKDLQRLPGIGPKLSQRIVDERGRRSFQSVQDLRRVPGIGPKTLEKIKPYVKV